MTRSRGYTFIGVMILLAVLATAAALTLQVAETNARRAAEHELLAIGGEFDAAFASYARMSPPGAVRHPQRLEDLVKDPRMAGVRRHLRRIYPDPLTGKAEWQLLVGPDGGIVAVASKAPGKPMQEHVTAYAAYAGASAPADKYAGWTFGEIPDFVSGQNPLTPIYPTPAGQPPGQFPNSAVQVPPMPAGLPGVPQTVPSLNAPAEAQAASS